MKKLSKTYKIVLIFLLCSSTFSICFVLAEDSEEEYPHPVLVWDVEPENHVGAIITLQFTAFTHDANSNESIGVKYKVVIDTSTIIDYGDKFVPYYINEALSIPTTNMLTGLHTFIMYVIDSENREVSLQKQITIDKTAPTINSVTISNTTIEEGNKPKISWDVYDEYFSHIEIRVNGTLKKTSELQKDTYELTLTLLINQIEAYYHINFLAKDSAGNVAGESWVVHYFIPESRFPRWSDDDIKDLINKYLDDQDKGTKQGMVIGILTALIPSIGFIPGSLARIYLQVPNRRRK